MSHKPNVIEFSNYDRVDESIIFQNVFDLLSKNKDVVIGGKTIGPSENIYKCSIAKDIFELHYDIDYGVNIISDSSQAISKLMQYFNN